jgi:hypothetical protein
VEAFKTEGILAGIKKIGATILDVILLPLQEIVELVAKFTGADWASSAAKSMEAFRKGIGVNVDPEDNSVTEKEAVNPRVSAQDALNQTIERIQKQNIGINIKDQTGRAEVTSDNNLVPVNLTSTMNWGNQ